MTPRRTLAAIAVLGLAVAVAGFVVVRARRGEVRSDRASTAEARPEAPPPLAAPPVPVGRATAPATGTGGSSGVVEAAPTEAAASVAQRRLEARVEFVDAVSGVAVGGARFDEETAPVRAGAWAYDVRHLVPVVESSGAAGAAVGPEPEGKTTWAQRAVLLPEGFVVFERPLASVPIARHARSLRTVQPLHREVAVRVTFVDERDRPALGARVTAWQVGDVVVGEPVVEAAADGTLGLRGVPWVPGATLRLGCARTRPEPVEGGTDVPFSITLGDASEDPSIDTPYKWPMPDSPRDPIEARVPIGALALEDLAGHMEFDWDASVVSLFDESGDPKTLGSARVTVLDAAGRAVAFVPVVLDGRRAVTDEHGVATFTALPTGTHAVAVQELGRLFASENVEVVAGVETGVTVRELEGGTLDVVVVDAAGETVPFARLRVVTPSKLPWLDVDADGVQRLDPFTDARGRRTLARVEPGVVTVYASCGDGHAKAEVDLLDGQRRSLRLEVR